MEFMMFVFIGLIPLFMLICCCCGPRHPNKNSRCREPRTGERLAHYCSRHACHGSHCRRNCRNCSINSTGEDICIHVIPNSGHCCEGHSASNNGSHSHPSSPPTYSNGDSNCGDGDGGCSSGD